MLADMEDENGGEDVMCCGLCPVCADDIEFRQFCDDFKCSGCGSLLRSEHECCHDDETDESWCADWLYDVTPQQEQP